jgi:hypothetical protein
MKDEPKAEQVEPKPIQQYTVAELKSLAYDQIILLQQTQNNINLLQAEIQKRDQVPGA